MTAARQVLRRVGPCIMALLTASLLIACASPGTTAMRPALPMDLPATLGDLPAGVQAPDADWVAAYGNAELVALVDETLMANPDLAVARARILAADARTKSMSAGLLPQLDASANATRVSGSTREGSAVETDRGVQLSMQYELDFWKAVRSARDGARAQAAGLRFDAQVLHISLQAAAVVAYIGVADLRARQQSVRDQQRALTESLEVLQARRVAGLAVASDLAGLRAQLATANATLGQLQQQEQDAAAALALLMGRSDAHLALAQARLDQLRTPPLTGTTPAELLLRRPDIASAEAALAAADANVAAARAALLPRVVLDLGVALQNPGFNAAVTTLEGTGLSSSLAASVLQPIFDGGRRRAERDVAVAEQQGMIAAYRGSLLTALVDAQRALAAEHAIGQQLEPVAANVAALQDAMAVLGARYSAGLGDRLALLDAQRALLGARDQQQQLRVQQLLASVGVYRAFGGGWQKAQQGMQQ